MIRWVFLVWRLNGYWRVLYELHNFYAHLKFYNFLVWTAQIWFKLVSVHVLAYHFLCKIEKLKESVSPQTSCSRRSLHVANKYSTRRHKVHKLIVAPRTSYSQIHKQTLNYNFVIYFTSHDYTSITISQIIARSATDVLIQFLWIHAVTKERTVSSPRRAAFECDSSLNRYIV